MNQILYASHSTWPTNSYDPFAPAASAARTAPSIFFSSLNAGMATVKDFPGGYGGFSDTEKRRPSTTGCGSLIYGIQQRK